MSNVLCLSLFVMFMYVKLHCFLCISFSPKHEFEIDKLWFRQTRLLTRADMLRAEFENAKQTHLTSISDQDVRGQYNRVDLKVT